MLDDGDEKSVKRNNPMSIGSIVSIITLGLTVFLWISTTIWWAGRFSSNIENLLTMNDTNIKIESSNRKEDVISIKTQLNADQASINDISGMKGAIESLKISVDRLSEEIKQHRLTGR